MALFRVCLILPTLVVAGLTALIFSYPTLNSELLSIIGFVKVKFGNVVKKEIVDKFYLKYLE